MGLKSPNRKHPIIKGYKLIRAYPGNHRIGIFEPYTTGLYSNYPEVWEPVYHDDVVRDKKLEELGIV